MFAEMLADRFAKRSGAEAMNDPHGLFALQQGAIEKLVRFFERVIDALADEVQLRGNWGLGARASGLGSLPEA